jgi:hypothetical protein
MTAMESGNASTPADTATDTHTINIQPKVVLAQSLGASWPAAVQNRSYGGGGFSNAVFSATGGIGSYVFPSTTPTSFPHSTDFSCVTASSTYTCSAVSVTAAPATYNPQVVVKDTGNTSTPASSTSTDPGSQTTAATLVVDAPLTLTAPTSPQTAVNGRAYGTGTGCSPTSNCASLNFAVANGLGGYAAATLPRSLERGRARSYRPITLAARLLYPTPARRRSH